MAQSLKAREARYAERERQIKMADQKRLTSKKQLNRRELLIKKHNLLLANARISERASEKLTTTYPSDLNPEGSTTRRGVNRPQTSGAMINRSKKLRTILNQRAPAARRTGNFGVPDANFLKIILERIMLDEIPCISQSDKIKMAHTYTNLCDMVFTITRSRNKITEKNFVLPTAAGQPEIESTEPKVVLSAKDKIKATKAMNDLRRANLRAKKYDPNYFVDREPIR
ncbi:MAG: hypothetical protein JKX76_01280 [Colwellia sp.]|nr:hypothetical protein [Colwellia sp.]